MGYSEAPPDVDEIVREMIAANHPRLAEFGVTVLCQMFESKSGLKLHGWPAAAVVKIVGEKDRIAGLADARITIDRFEWAMMGMEGRRALIDHELCHLTVKTEKRTFIEVDPADPDEIKTINVVRDVAIRDDADRPVLKMRLHDWELSGFKEIVQRHGDAAIERISFRETAERHRQLLLGEWADEDVAAESSPVASKAFGRRKSPALATATA